MFIMFIMFTCSSTCVGSVIINEGCWGGGWNGAGGAGVVGVDPLEGAESTPSGKVSKSVFDNLQLHNSLTHSNF